MMTRQDFEKTLVAETCVSFWLSKTKTEVSKLLGPDVANMVGFDQCNPHHCYDLFSHSLHTVENVQHRLHSTASENIQLLVAAFFHDIGKVPTARRKENRLVFYGHAKQSAENVCPILKQMGYSEDEIKQICFYISHHDDFISYVLPDEDHNRSNPYLIEITPENIQKHKNLVESTFGSDCLLSWRELWFNLIILCYADAESQSRFVISGGRTVSSLASKTKRIYAIELILKSIFEI